MFCCANLQAQNIEGQIVAAQYGQWTVPGTSPNTYAFSPTSCRVQGGASYFFAFAVGTPVTIVDANPALSETVVPSSYIDTNVTCQVSIAPLNNHQMPFHLQSATGGLQEAINQNLTAPLTNTIVLTNQWYQFVGSGAAAVIAAAQGSANLGLVDVTTVPTTWYAWNGTQYAKVSITGTAGSLNTRLGDTLYNNGPNTAAVDADIFISTAPTTTNTTISPQTATNNAATNGGSAVLGPGVGRTAFTNAGDVRVQDNRVDVPANARQVTEFGAACDLRNVYGTLSQGSNVVTILSGYSALFSSADIGRVIVAVGSVSGVPTVFESTVTGIIDGNHATVTTNAPFTQATNHQMDLGHDDTGVYGSGGIVQAMFAANNAAGGAGGTLVFPEGNCLTHTQSLYGQSLIGLGPNSFITGFPGEDIFAAPDPSQTSGASQGPAHVHDLTFYVDGRIDATQPWQIINDSGTTAKAANYRPIGQTSPATSNPLAPGWFQGPGPNLSGAINGVANITAASVVMCVPSTETAPSVGQEVVFPYLTTIFTATVSSTAGSCSGGASPRTLSSALPTGSTNTQAEWFAGSSPQNLATSISSGSCPATITLSNSIGPAPGYEVNVAPFGLIQIDAEQFSYFGKSNANNPSPANTLYNVQCAQNGTARAAHASSATVVPLNQFKPSYPWPVVPTLNSGDTTPASNAGFFPAWNVGNAAFAFPIATGIANPQVGSWSANAKIENLSFYPWPSDINGQQWGEVNHTAPFYFVQPYYAAHFTSILSQYLFYGIVGGPTSIENGNWLNGQPTEDSSGWNDVAIWAAVPMVQPLGNQITYTNFNAYSNEATSGGTNLGADICYYFNSMVNDQGGGSESNSVVTATNFYCEPETGAHAQTMPMWEWDTYNSLIHGQHMGGGGEVAIGGGSQHWLGGNFNNSPALPAINYGAGNTSDWVANLGSEPKSNVYGTGSLINFDPNSRFSGTTAQAYGSPSGPYGSVARGNNREPIPAQTNETWNTGNTTVPYTSSGGGFITPEEFNSLFSFESQAMTQGWTYDSTSPVTNSYAACTVGNNSGTTYCSTFKFNQQQISIGHEQRLAPGKYTLYISMKDAVTSTNTETLTVGSNCGGVSNTYSIPITNAWPTTAAGVFTNLIDFTAATGSNCYVIFNFQGATTADSIQVGYVDFAPYAENLRANTLTVNNIITPNGPSGGTPTGCTASPVTGISNGFACPTKGWGTTLAANQLIGDTVITLSGSLAALSPSGCFFVDSEYECYAAISGSTLTGLTRGAYTTTAAAHSNGTAATAVDLVLGSVQQPPLDVITAGGTAPTILSANNGFPANHGGANVLEINGGSNETWFNLAGTVQQTNTSDTNRFSSPVQVGNVSLAMHPAIADSQQVLQSNGQNQTYSALGLGGGIAGSVNIAPPSTVGAPAVFDFSGGGSTTRSYVCSGIDTDGNLIPGTTATLSSTAASFSSPQFVSIVCPQAAGVSQFQIWRTVGGPSQGLLSTTSSTQSAGFQDFNGAASGGTPPVSNTSNPHLSVTGSGNACIQMGTAQLCSGTGAPTSACGTTPVGSGSLWMRTDGSTSTSLYSCAASTWTAVTIP